IRSLVRELRPVRRLPSLGRRTLVWAGLALLCVGLGCQAVGARPDLWLKLHNPAYLVENAVLLAVFGLAARGAFELAIPGLERRHLTLALPLVGLLLWVLAVAARLAGETGGSSPSVVCGERMALLAVGPAVAGFLMLRRAAPAKRGAAGLLALLSAGSVSMVGTQMLCRHDQALHILFWHVVPLVGLALVGAAAGKLALRRAYDALRTGAKPASTGRPASVQSFLPPS